MQNNEIEICYGNNIIWVMCSKPNVIDVHREGHMESIPPPIKEGISELRISLQAIKLCSMLSISPLHIMTNIAKAMSLLYFVSLYALLYISSQVSSSKFSPVSACQLALLVG